MPRPGATQADAHDAKAAGSSGRMCVGIWGIWGRPSWYPFGGVGSLFLGFLEDQASQGRLCQVPWHLGGRQGLTIAHRTEGDWTFSFPTGPKRPRFCFQALWANEKGIKQTAAMICGSRHVGQHPYVLGGVGTLYFGGDQEETGHFGAVAHAALQIAR